MSKIKYTAAAPDGAGMKLSNPWMRVYVTSDAKRFRVVKVVRSFDEANAYCAANAGCGVIASDADGNHYIAEDKDEAKNGGAA